ncbi:Hypothetical protein NocV09_01500370 [Nannochloropsis oceanica]
MTTTSTTPNCSSHSRSRRLLPSLLLVLLLASSSLLLIEAFTPLRQVSPSTFLPLPSSSSAASPSSFCPFPRQSPLPHQIRRDTSLYGLFGGKAAPAPEPPAKTGLYSGLLGKKTTSAASATTGPDGRKRRLVRKKVKAASSTREARKDVKKKDTKTEGKKANMQRSTLQRDNSWDVIEKERVPLSSIVIGVGSAAAVGGYFFKRRWALRNEQLVNDFVDDMMGAGMDTSELYRIAMSYKAKLGPFATPRILNEYLKAVFRAPDLSSSMAKGQEFVGMSILLFTFERILPPALSETQLEPLRRALGKALPGNVEDNMFELAKDAYSLEVESLFIRGENPVLAPEGYEVMGLPFDEAEKVFKRVKRSYEGNDAQHDGGTEGGEDLGASLIVRRKEPLHDMIYGKAEDIADKYIVGYKEEKDRKKAAKLRGNRPPSWDETVERISEMVLTKEGEQVIESLQKFQCLRCQRLTTLMPGQLEEDIFTPDYKCPQCKSTRDMVVRKS